MARRKKIIIWAVVIVVLVGGFLALRISSWTRTYGLSQEVIQGEKAPTAEETIRLYFYYGNRNHFDEQKKLLTEEEATNSDMIEESNGALMTALEHGKDWLLKDVELINVRELEVSDGEDSTLVQEFKVETSEDYLRAPKETVMWSLIYRMVRTDDNRPWRIDEIGKC